MEDTELQTKDLTFSGIDFEKINNSTQDLKVFGSKVSEDLTKAFHQIEQIAVHLNNFNIFVELSKKERNNFSGHMNSVGEAVCQLKEKQEKEMENLKTRIEEMEQLIVSLRNENKALKDNYKDKLNVINEIQMILGAKEKRETESANIEPVSQHRLLEV